MFVLTKLGIIGLSKGLGESFLVNAEPEGTILHNTLITPLSHPIKTKVNVKTIFFCYIHTDTKFGLQLSVVELEPSYVLPPIRSRSNYFLRVSLKQRISLNLF